MAGEQRDFGPELTRLHGLIKTATAEEAAAQKVRDEAMREKRLDKAVNGTRGWFRFVDPSEV